MEKTYFLTANLFITFLNNSYLFILPAAWQRVLPQVHLCAIFVVDLCVQVVLLPASGRADYFLLEVAAWICFGLFSVLKAQRGQLRSDPFQFLTAPRSKLCLQRGWVFYSPGDVEVVEQLPLREAFLQEAVGLFGSHLGHGAVDFSRGHVRPLHQTSYASHAAARGEGRGWERVTEGFVRAAAQRESLD